MVRGQAADSNAANAKHNKTYAKRISDHIAYALIVYTMMLIFLVAGSIKTSSMSVFPYILLIVFVAVVIPLARKLEKKWEALDDSELSENSLRARFTIDRTKLWIGTIGIPLILMVVCKAVSALF